MFLDDSAWKFYHYSLVTFGLILLITNLVFCAKMKLFLMRKNNAKQDGSSKKSSSKRSSRTPQVKSNEQKTQPGSGDEKDKMMAKSDQNPKIGPNTKPQKVDTTQESVKSAHCIPAPKATPNGKTKDKTADKSPAAAAAAAAKPTSADAVPRSKIQSVKFPRAERGYREKQIADMEKFLNEPSTAE